MNTAIFTALQGMISMFAVGQLIYTEVTKFMDAVQYEGGNGANKKEWVMSAAKNLIQEANKNWDKWAKYISDFIDAAKSIYNSVKGIL